MPTALSRPGFMKKDGVFTHKGVATWMGADGAPEHLNELGTMHGDEHSHRSLRIDRQQHGSALEHMTHSDASGRGQGLT